MRPYPDAFDVLELAAQLVDRNGLARGRYAGPGDRVSVEGAIQRAFRQLGGSWSVDPGPVHEATALVAAALDGEPVGAWSDEATEEQAADLLRSAARSSLRTPEPVAAATASDAPNPYEW